MTNRPSLTDSLLLADSRHAERIPEPPPLTYAHYLSFILLLYICKDGRKCGNGTPRLASTGTGIATDGQQARPKGTNKPRGARQWGATSSLKSRSVDGGAEMEVSTPRSSGALFEN
jgi:hypothetical protein